MFPLTASPRIPPAKPTGALTWITAITAVVVLACTYWAPQLLDARLWIVVVLALTVIAFWWQKQGGPAPLLQGIALLIGLFVALLSALALGPPSPLPAWLNNNAAAIQGLAAIGALALLLGQTRMITWQSEISQRLLALELGRDAANLKIEGAVMVRPDLLELTLTNRGVRGSEIDTVEILARPATGPPTRRFADLSTADITPEATGHGRTFIPEGSRRVLHLDIPDWPADLAYPVDLEVQVQPLLGPSAAYKVRMMADPVSASKGLQD